MSDGLVIVCLLDYQSVSDVLGALSGRVLVNLTNGTPAQARELAAGLHDLALLSGMYGMVMHLR